MDILNCCHRNIYSQIRGVSWPSCATYSSQKQGPSLSTTAFGRLGPFRFGLSGFSCIFLRWLLFLGLTFSGLGCGWGFRITITIIITMFFLLFPCLLDILFDTFVAELNGDQVRDGTTDSNLLCLKLFVKPKMLLSMQDDSICDRWLSSTSFALENAFTVWINICYVIVGQS